MMEVGLEYLASLNNAVEKGKRNMKGLIGLRVTPVSITSVCYRAGQGGQWGWGHTIFQAPQSL